MTAEEAAIATAAIHEIGVEFAPEFCLGFGNDAGKVGDPLEFGVAGRDISRANYLRAGLAVLNDLEVVAPDGGHQKGGGFGRNAFVGEVFYEVEKLARLGADAGEEGEVFVGVVAVEIRIAALIGSEAAAKKLKKSFVPGHAGKVPDRCRVSTRRVAFGRAGLTMGRRC